MDNNHTDNMSNTDTVVVIGGGLGGLFTGAILAKMGHKVTVLEKNVTVGGGLQTFCRHGITFETGMHILGSLHPGDSIYKLCQWLGIYSRLALCDVDADSMDQIAYLSDGKTYRVPMGREAFTAYFQQEFPEEAEEIKAYVDKLYAIVDEIDFFYLRTGDSHVFSHCPEFMMPADELVNRYLKNPRLCDVISYMNPMYGGKAGHTPGYIHALINVLYINGATRFVGGSQQMVTLLTEVIEQGGGSVLGGDEVTAIDIEDRQIQAVHTRKGHTYVANRYVAAIHPAALLRLTDSKAFPKSYRTRIAEAPNSYSSFCVYVVFKPEAFPYINHTCYFQNDYGKVWHFYEYDAHDWPRGFMYMTPCAAQQGAYAKSMIINSPMPFSACEQFADSSLGHRSEEYKAWKQRHVDAIMRKMETLYPGFGEKCAYVFGSSPLTIRDFYNEPEGALYGLERDSENIAQSQVPVFTKVRNLFMTGQNVNLHGFCGVPLTAINTSEAIVGLNEVVNRINDFANNNS